MEGSKRWFLHPSANKSFIFMSLVHVTTSDWSCGSNTLIFLPSSCCESIFVSSCALGMRYKSVVSNSTSMVFMSMGLDGLGDDGAALFGDDGVDDGNDGLSTSM